MMVDPLSIKFRKVDTSTSTSNKLQWKPVYTTNYKNKVETKGISKMDVAHCLLSIDADCPPAKKMKYCHDLTMDYKMTKKNAPRPRTFRRGIRKNMSLPKLGAFNVKDRDAAISRTGAGISYLIQNKTANDQKCIKATNISAL